jgi:alpha-L-fucosidase
MMRARRAVWVLAVLMALVRLAGAEEKKSEQAFSEETKEQRDARMAWWREAKFGMFIHWGLYAVSAGKYGDKDTYEAWLMNHAHIPVAEYAKYADKFNPVKFNAEEWVKTAKGAGMKYMIITSKHHEGFAMFHTKVDGYNIYDATPWHHDPLAELAAACRKEGIKLGFYYSQAQDWHHPGGAATFGKWDPAQEGSFDKYIDTVAVPQVRELLSNYGEFPSVLWWDTPRDYMSVENAEKLYGLAKELKPDIIMNNRLIARTNGPSYLHGDEQTPELWVPAAGHPWTKDDWECGMTFNDHWGYCAADQNWKRTEDLLYILVDVASKGGNYLLNVGPTAEGLIPPPSVERLAQMGEWMKINGEAIYGSHGSAFGYEYGTPPVKGWAKGRPQAVGELDWRCTTKPGRLYFCLLKWPGEKFSVKEMKSKANKAYLLADPERKPLAMTQEGGVLRVTLPAQAPGQFINVLCVELGEQNNKTLL